MPKQPQEEKEWYIKEFRETFKNPENTGYRVGDEFLGAIELFLHKVSTRATENLRKQIEGMKKAEGFVMNNKVFPLGEKKENMAYNQALSDVLALLSPKGEENK